MEGFDLSTPTQKERDELRGWNDIPTVLISKPSSQSNVKSRRRYIAENSTSTTAAPPVAKIDTNSAPPTELPVPPTTHTATLVLQTQSTVAFTSVCFLCTLSCIYLISSYVYSLFFLQHPHVKVGVKDELLNQVALLSERNGGGKVVDDIKKRLAPLLDKLDDEAISSICLKELGSFVAALKNNEHKKASDIQVALVMKFSEEIGTASLALKKLVYTLAKMAT
eukprot:m.44955 g.44955  ORF g.44955 m.44955 type:complete len:223 (+) comp7194_c0_seq1:49-717(+)